MRPRLALHIIDLAVVSGDMIDGTIIVQRRDPDTAAARRAHGALPTVEQFTSAIVGAINAATPADDTVYVGGANYLEKGGRTNLQTRPRQAAPSNTASQTADGSEVSRACGGCSDMRWLLRYEHRIEDSAAAGSLGGVALGGVESIDGADE